MAINQMDKTVTDYKNATNNLIRVRVELIVVGVLGNFPKNILLGLRIKPVTK